MCRRAGLDLPPLPASAGEARRFIADTCARWELPELRDDLLLAVSELVTNSVLHARTPISVHVAVAAGAVEVGVCDYDPRPPVVREARTDLISDLDTLTVRLPSFDDPDPRHPNLTVGPAGSVAAGRGLHLLDAVCDAWGVVSFSDGDLGKEVWFVVAVPPDWPGRASCPCGGEDVTASTASGRPLAAVPGT